MSLTVAFVLYHVLFVFWLLIIARFVIEIVRSFARSWTPTRSRAVVLEVIYLATDPPVKLLRRLIPTVRIAGVGLDLSITILLVVASIAMNVVHPSTVRRVGRCGPMAWLAAHRCGGRRARPGP